MSQAWQRSLGRSAASHRAVTIAPGRSAGRVRGGSDPGSARHDRESGRARPRRAHSPPASTGWRASTWCSSLRLDALSSCSAWSSPESACWCSSTPPATSRRRRPGLPRFAADAVGVLGVDDRPGVVRLDLDAVRLLGAHVDHVVPARGVQASRRRRAEVGPASAAHHGVGRTRAARRPAPRGRRRLRYLTARPRTGRRVRTPRWPESSSWSLPPRSRHRCRSTCGFPVRWPLRLRSAPTCTRPPWSRPA